MKQYIIKFRKRDTEERSLVIQQFETFPEAASWSYVNSNKLGFGWYIESISEK